jgi:hypothetical protein
MAIRHRQQQQMLRRQQQQMLRRQQQQQGLQEGEELYLER